MFGPGLTRPKAYVSICLFETNLKESDYAAGIVTLYKKIYSVAVLSKYFEKTSTNRYQKKSNQPFIFIITVIFSSNICLA